MSHSQKKKKKVIEYWWRTDGAESDAWDFEIKPSSLFTSFSHTPAGSGSRCHSRSLQRTSHFPWWHRPHSWNQAVTEGLSHIQLPFLNSEGTKLPPLAILLKNNDTQSKENITFIQMTNGAFCSAVILEKVTGDQWDRLATCACLGLHCLCTISSVFAGAE